MPADRWDHAIFYDPDPTIIGKVYTKHGAFIDGWDTIGGSYCNIRDAAETIADPQQKMCLKAGLDAFANADLTRETLSHLRIGVFVGVMTYDWYEKCIAEGTATMSDQPHMVGSRISYALSLRGPSTTIDTACSSSLVAASATSKVVSRSEVDYGLTLGVCHMAAGKTFVGRCAGHLLSRTGRSFTFSDGGDGYCRGEGHGGIVFGRRESGKKGCPLLASSEVNEDGKSATLVAPNGIAQQELLKIALRSAQLTPAEVTCCECRPMALPLEIRLNSAHLTEFRRARVVKTRWCYVQPNP